jgi:CMP-N-acetylneuraminic acid synthetase
MNTWFIIPARKGSKGLPQKNRKLFDYTAKTIPAEINKSVIVSSDDEYILGQAKEYGFLCHRRSHEFSQDTTDVKSALQNIVVEHNIMQDDNIIMLYLTYPQRTMDDITAIYNFFKKQKAKSLLCRQSIKSHPYLCMFELGDYRGKQIIEHNLYRRQDYPKCFVLSHFVFITKTKELKYLNNNLYNVDTIFFPIDEVIDVDEKKHLEQFHEN